MSTKKNKILQNAPIGYYVVEYNPIDGLIKTPIISFVFYFENTQNDYETISTNYLTINDTNKMIQNSSIPKEVRLYIKGSDKPSVTKNMAEIYKSDMLDLSRSLEYVIN